VRWIRTLAFAALAIALLTPGAAADAPFSAPELAIDGHATTAGPLGALFFLDEGERNEALSWDATASSVVVEREWKNFTGLAADGTPLGSFSKYDDKAQKQMLRFGAATLSSEDVRDNGALLAKVLDGDVAVTADTRGSLVMRPSSDPEFHQAEVPDVGEAVDYAIHERIHGDYVVLVASDATVELRGTITLRLSDVDYLLSTPGGAYEGRSGIFITKNVGPYYEGTSEKQTLTLKDAVLHLRAASPVVVASPDPKVTFTGKLAAKQPTGLLDLPGLVSSAPGEWTGDAATLTLAPHGGLLTVPAAQPVAATGASLAARPPAALAWLVVGAALVALALAIVGLRHRETGDDLELALLAMSERRWNDALPRLERLAAKRPQDGGLLVDRALCLEETGRLDEARAGYEAALQAAPFSAEAHYYYSRTLARLRMGTAALAHLSRALTLDARLAELARGERAFASFADHPQFRGLVR
jgi:hypothetical protein